MGFTSPSVQKNFLLVEEIRGGVLLPLGITEGLHLRKLYLGCFGPSHFRLLLPLQPPILSPLFYVEPSRSGTFCV